MFCQRAAHQLRNGSASRYAAQQRAPEGTPPTTLSHLTNHWHRTTTPSEGSPLTTNRDPFGRRYRTRDEETTERMLQAGVAKVDREGLPVSFDLLRLEDIIAEAGVARSAVYRRWPTKNHYYADLLRHLAGAHRPALAAYDPNTISYAVSLAHRNLNRLTTPEQRRAVLVDICRQGALKNFMALVNSPAWRVYITLTATMGSLPADVDLKADLEKALHRSELHFYQRMAIFYEAFLGVLGFSLRRDVGEINLETAAQLGGAIVEGLAINSIADKSVLDRRFTTDPFGTGEVADWSLPALGFTNIIMGLIEPDPDAPIHWDEAYIAKRREALEAFEKEFEELQSQSGPGKSG